MHDNAPRPELLAGLPRPGQWAVLLVGSGGLAALFAAMGLPAALLLGPMLMGIVAGVNGATIRPPRLAFIGAQAVVGCLISHAIEPDILASFFDDWPLFVSVVLATLAASCLIGYLISRWSTLPGTTAVWGSTPGGASAMVLMAEAFGADARLVAFMQYLRVIFVTLTAAVISGLMVDMSGVQAPAIDWFPPIDGPSFGATLVVAAAGAWLGRVLRLPAGSFFGPMAIGTALHLGGYATLQLPQWLLAVSYAVIGWWIGLNFTRAILSHAFRALPQIVASIVALVAFCAVLGMMMSEMLGIDPLTAYLSTSPGGMDSVAIIAAASSNVDMSFIMGLQLARLVIVLLLGPPLARLLSRRVGR